MSEVSLTDDAILSPINRLQFPIPRPA
ncbi:uncharacterized protein G2W53_005198 [Senna tora]|uniref:Uncharacterized protein n=1 Tax=Senna tora TaxID=362788 RepID=A0A834XED0_9FABA|nr:uncharacterized protein G2W53_005198 [Senna tora]